MRIWRTPWPWVGLALLGLNLAPDLDLTVAGWFWDETRKVFPARTQSFPEWVRRDMPVYIFALAGLIALAGLAARWLGRPVAGIGPRQSLFALSSLALGPGLVVNLILKSNWGRPRPSTLTIFGGDDTYVPPWIISQQCDSNCAFVSGHAALGFWLVAVALLAPPRFRTAAVILAFGFGAMVAAIRVMQGAHFLSDVVWAGYLTLGLTMLLHELFRIGKNPSESKK